MAITVNQWRNPLERRSASAFALAGVLIFASLIVPIGLEALATRSWVTGLVLVGLAVVTVAADLFGLYPQVNNRSPGLALAGAGAAAVAGVAALGLIAFVGTALAAESVSGLSVSEPMSVFSILGLSMTGGLSLGFVLFGVAGWRTEAPARAVSELLIAGGVALLTLVAVELLGSAFGVGTPAWLLFPVIAGVALDTLAIGYCLRARVIASE